LRDGPLPARRAASRQQQQQHLPPSPPLSPLPLKPEALKSPGAHRLNFWPQLFGRIAMEARGQRAFELAKSLGLPLVEVSAALLTLLVILFLAVVPIAHSMLNDMVAQGTLVAKEEALKRLVSVVDWLWRASILYQLNEILETSFNDSPFSVQVISLDQAPEGYGEFDAGVPKKFVIDPHKLFSAA